VVRASGGIWLGNNSAVSIPAGRFIQTSTGAYLSNGGAWTNNSDRALKENLRAVDGRTVLAELVGLPLYTWHYAAEGLGVGHIGPTAQDFAATFGVGADETHIATVDADGVALAAIQGLHQLLQEKGGETAQLTAENAALEADNTDLRDRVDRVEDDNAALRAQDTAQQSELEQMNGRLAAVEARAGGQTPAGTGLFDGWAGATLALVGAAGVGVTVGRRLR
jgi:hypothetical protein